MPQIYVMISPRAKLMLGLERAITLLPKIEKIVKQKLILNFGVPEVDVAFSAIDLLFTSNEANIQIEIRYTVGPDIYVEGQIFNPTDEQQKSLAHATIKALTALKPFKGITFSMWMKPHINSYFKFSHNK